MSSWEDSSQMLAVPLDGTRSADLDSLESLSGDYTPPGISLQNLALLHTQEEEQKHSSNQMYNGMFRHGLTWADAAPEDAIVHAFSFLHPSEMGPIAAVCKAWKHVSYDASLWRNLSLSHVWWKVSDATVLALLKTPRFTRVTEINLSGCIEITDAVMTFIADNCSYLEKLVLTDCRRLTPEGLYYVAHRSRSLTHLEIWGITGNMRLARKIRDTRPGLEFPLFWRRVCAFNGLDEVTGERVTVERCKYGLEEDAFAQRACWGSVGGQLVWANDFYPRKGNYPSEIIYFCENHVEEINTDEEILRCEYCERYFKDGSMRHVTCCNVCYDQVHLSNENHWIPLTKKRISEFGLTDLFERSLSLSFASSLPHTLQVYGTAPVRIDLTLSEEHRHIDRSNVPLDVFFNRQCDPPEARGQAASLPIQLDELRDSLLVHSSDAAQADGQTRALMCFNKRRDIQILADCHPITSGTQGEEHLALTCNAWRYALNIVYPFLALILLMEFFIYAMRAPEYTEYSGSSPQSNYATQLQQSREETVSLEYILIMFAIFAFVLLCGVFLALRFRERCIQFLKLFVFLDVMLLFGLGTGIVLNIIVALLPFNMEYITFFLIIWNFASVGMYTLYSVSPPSLHRFFVVALFFTMGVMMVLTLHVYIVFFFAAFYAMLDFFGTLSERYQVFSAFILWTTPAQRSNPRILYPVHVHHRDGVTLRSIDFLWIGLVLGLVDPYWSTLVMIGCACLGGITITVFVSPFFGRAKAARITPVVAVFAMVVMLSLMGTNVVLPYLSKYNTMLERASVVIPETYEMQG